MTSQQITETLERIRTEFSKLRSRDFRRSVFGSKSHGYELNGALAADALEAFEKEHHVSLPEEYRRFLTEIGDGGAGPAYGVHPLAKALDNPWMPLGDLQPSFSVDEDRQHANYQGCLMISQRGCGGWTFLVVSGPQRGEVWYDDTVAGLGFKRANESFLSWYENWLAHSLEEIAGRPKDETAEYVETLTSICENAPDRLPAVLEQEPDQEWLLKPLMVVAFSRMQANQTASALLIYQRLFRLPTPAAGPVRTAYLEALNNGVIAACMVKDFQIAAAISDTAQPFVEENPFIAHSAACAYMGVGDPEKALQQCRLAVRFKYKHLDLLAKDQDLAPLFSHPEFKTLFAK